MSDSSKKFKEPEEIEMPAYVGHGTGRIYLRAALPPEHQESEWNYILKHYPGVNPLHYGAKPPRQFCSKCGRPEDEP